MTEKKINSLRQKIDHIDQQICQLIQQRKEISQEIGNYKKSHQLPIKDIARESKHIETLQKAFHTIDANLIREVIQKIIDDSVKQQQSN